MNILDRTEQLVPQLLLGNHEEFTEVVKVVSKFQKNYFVGILKYKGIRTEVRIEPEDAVDLILSFDLNINTINRVW